MKGLSLWQPWATLIALGHKRVETRHWPTRYRGPIAIHAAKRKMTDEEIEYVYELSLLFGLSLPDPLDLTPAWPLGYIVATASLTDCKPMTAELIDAQSELEYQVGNWERGRYAWFLEDIKPVPQPIPARGAQGLWEWTPPAAVEVPA
jgi:hypothetical protein